MKFDDTVDEKVVNQLRDSLENGDTVAIYGAASGGLRVLNAIEEANLNVTVKYIVDNDKSKQGSSLNGVPVKDPSSLRNASVDKVIIATSVDTTNIKSTLTNEGISSYIDVYHK